MKPYLNLLQEVLDNGTWQANRTGVRTKFLPGAMLKFDLTEGFPIVTTRKAPFKGSVAEMIGFLRGYTNAAQFRDLGCPFWTANANQTPSWLASPFRKGEDDVGQVYGHFWRNWQGDDGSVTDQVMDALNTLHRDPTNRRIIVSGWKAEAIKQGRGALPPCHISWHLMANVERRELSLCMWQRSCDIVLGIGGGNITGYAFLLAWIARLTGYTPKWLVMHLDDVHVYENHMDGAMEQLAREPRPLPKLVFDDTLPHFCGTGRPDGSLNPFHPDYVEQIDKFQPEWIDRIEPSQVWLDGYDPHPAIKFEMAV